MRRLFLAGLVVVAVVVPIGRATADARYEPSVLRSIRPIQQVYVNNHGETLLGNVCSASSIHAKNRLWLTAAHCVDPSDGLKYLVGELVQVVVRDVINDVAIVRTPMSSAPALKLSDKAPRLEDRIKVAGYPFGYVYPLLTIGTVASTFDVLSPKEPPYLVFQVAGAPGNSGSPVLNTQNEIISVIQIGWGRGFSPIMAGVLYETLARYRLYFE